MITVQIIDDKPFWEALASHPLSVKGYAESWNTEPGFAPNGEVSFMNRADFLTACKDLT